MASTPSKSSAAPSEASSVKSMDSSTPPSALPADKPESDSSKLKTFLGILRKFVGVSDIANVRFSLPAQLLEPIPNLEYWHYLDRPETFVSIGESDDEIERMLEVLRFWFTKDLKYVKGKPCKPYNSALGEFFRCNWDIKDDEHPISEITTQKSSETLKKADGETVRVSYLTEQTSHHPPVSAFYVDCPKKGVTARGFDQISAKFTGTSVRVTPGQHNLGIFINLEKRGDEEYQLTHPAANLGGILRGALAVSVSDHCFITCPKTKLKTILYYLEEGWLGKSQNRVQGAIFRYDPSNDKYSKLKDVPEKDIVCKLDGCWQDKVYYTRVNTNSSSTPAGSRVPSPLPPERIQLIDLSPLWPVPKDIPPPSQQLPNESRQFWSGVTDAIKSKQYSLATRLKQDLEERQREKAAKRKEEGVEWKPRFFTENLSPVGKPDLSEEGRLVLKGLHEGNYDLKPSNVLAA